MGSKGDGNRQRIIDKADDLFYRRGFAVTSFQDISDATGIPRGNFYYYFKTKEEILDAVLDHRVNGFKEELAEIDVTTADPAERLKLLIESVYSEREEVMRSGCAITTMCSELTKDDSNLREKSTEAFSVFLDWMRKQFELMGLSDAKLHAMNLLNKIEGNAILANVFKDIEYYNYGHKDMLSFVEGLR